VKAKDELGRTGEQVAVEYLERAGLRILDRNWRSRDGEVDIVAADRRVLVVCEVKTRSGTRFGTPLEAVTRHKRARLRRLAAQWLVAHGVLFDEVRIDVIGVIKDKSGEFQIEHVRGVG
jgi:putative endonuclease